MKTVKDYTVTGLIGFFICPECGCRFSGSGTFSHKPNCTIASHKDCIYHVGPKMPEFATAEEVVIDPTYALVIENADVPAEEAKG